MFHVLQKDRLQSHGDAVSVFVSISLNVAQTVFADSYSILELVLTYCMTKLSFVSL